MPSEVTFCVCITSQRDYSHVFFSTHSWSMEFPFSCSDAKITFSYTKMLQTVKAVILVTYIYM